MNSKITYLMVAAVAVTALSMGLPSLFQDAAAFHTNTATGGNGGAGGNGGNGGSFGLAIGGSVDQSGGDGGDGGRGGDADASTFCAIVAFC
jgi:hypothetical protein